VVIVVAPAAAAAAAAASPEHQHQEHSDLQSNTCVIYLSTDITTAKHSSPQECRTNKQRRGS